jgi:hypothetical protein
VNQLALPDNGWIGSGRLKIRESLFLGARLFVSLLGDGLER